VDRNFKYGSLIRPTMSVTDRSGREGSALDELPEFDLAFILDEEDGEQSVTVYRPDSLETTWMTADAEAAVSLNEVR
jgi:hypothetical protein